MSPSQRCVCVGGIHVFMCMPVYVCIYVYVPVYMCVCVTFHCHRMLYLESECGIARRKDAGVLTPRAVSHAEGAREMAAWEPEPSSSVVHVSL